MAFDEDLQHAFETVTGRLGEEIARVASEIARSANAARDEAVRAALQDAEREAEERLSAAVAAAEAYAIERAVAEGRRQREEGRREGHDEGRQAGLQDGHLAGLQEGRQAGLQEGRLEERQLAEQRLTAAVDGAVGVARAEARAAERAAAGRLADGIEALGRGRSLTEILDALVTSAARETARAAIVVVRDGRFSGWRFVGFGPALDAPGPVEFGSAEAGVIGDAARTGVLAASDEQRGVAPAFAGLPPDGESAAAPLVMGGEVVAVLYADAGTDGGRPDTRGQQERPLWVSTLAILARHAGRCLETVTAFRAASAAADRRAPAPVQRHASPSRDSRLDDQSAAERYARLLVSEIKLYHEAEVIAGRRERDLMARLGGEIARARGLYEQRVPPPVRTGTDHFHAELLRMLANGDESLLEVRT